MRRLITSLYAVALSLALPAAAFAADTAKPTGHDWTLDSILVALSIPVILGLLTLIDIARGKHTQRHDH